MYISMYVCIYVCTYVCVCVCMRARACVSNFSFFSTHSKNFGNRIFLLVRHSREKCRYFSVSMFRNKCVKELMKCWLLQNDAS
jgi:hypothetical protein